MNHHHRSSLIALLFAVCATPICCAQAATPVDIYANFVGNWIGNVQSVRDGVELTEPVRIEIIENRKRDGIICEYFNGQAGSKEFVHSTRKITFSSEDEKMTSQWRIWDTNSYRTMGLKTFALTGYGLFIADFVQLERGQMVSYRGHFKLDADTFSYRWQKSTDGKTFTLSSILVVHREQNQQIAHP